MHVAVCMSAVAAAGGVRENQSGSGAAELTVYAWQCLLERPKQKAKPRQSAALAVTEKA